MTLESKLNLQKTRLKNLENAFNFFKDKDISSITKNQIQGRIDFLEANWVKFDKEHERIVEAKAEVLQNIEYINEDHYSRGKEAYLVNKAELLDLLDSVLASSLQSASITESNKSNSVLRPALPKITLTQFSGNYQSWKPFSDLFTSLVISNPELTDVARLHYLKNSLVGEAAQLISNFQITGENFTPAWEKLVARYENKRVLVNKHLDDIFHLQPLRQKSAKGLNHLMSTVNECLGSLKALGSPTDQWDQILVYIIVHRLDADTHEAWEIHQGVSTEPSTLQDLQTFIEGRVRALENIESREASHSGGLVTLSKSQGKPNHKPNINAALVAESQSNKKTICALCNKDHFLAFCKEFYGKTPIQRKEFLLNKNLCFNCLGSHLLKDCRSKKSCLKCHKRHHTLIHDVVQSTNTSSQGKTQSQSHNQSSIVTSPNEQASSNHTLPSVENGRQVVLLATAQVKVVGPEGNSIIVKALIDQGSEISFISEYLVQTLHLKRSSSSYSLIGIGGNRSSTTRGVVSINLGSPFNNNVSCPLSAHVLPKLTSSLPSMKVSQSSWPHLEGLTLADPTFMTPSTIDLILGADIYSSIIQPQLIKGPALTPIAQSTIFGWILSGPTGGIAAHSNASMYHCLMENEVDELIHKFWEQEEVPKDTVQVLSPENQKCEDYYASTVSRDPSGRYQVRLPLKESTDLLGDSQSSAYKMLQSLTRRLSSDPEYNNLYSNFINEYKALQHMNEVIYDTDSTIPVYYLPHHGVLRPSSTTTKLRVVFNASFPTSSGKSLNDILHCGPKLQTELPDVLTWFRRFKFVFAADIEKMYRQILVHPDDQPLQRILWFENGNLCKYQLQTVTYGLACAPFLALRTVNQLIFDHGHCYPKASETMMRGRYVDDVFGGADSIEECQKLAKEVDELCKLGCFPLQKWISNEESALSLISSTNCDQNHSLLISESSVLRTLGLTWNRSTDKFQFVPTKDPIDKITKRNVLSKIAQLFDPLGFITPITIRYKVFMQQLWLIKLNWDEILPPHLQNQWRNFESELQNVSSIEVPRYLGLNQTSLIEIHGFCDASKLAMSAVVYVRICHTDSINVGLVISKTKVAPLKTISIPRLELMAAVLLVKLVKHTRKILDLESAIAFLWTDSSVSLTWITSHSSKWKDFVRNRVSLIQETEPLARWRHVAGNENPADCASRGVSPKVLSNHNLWWTGPKWLSTNENEWPSTDFNPTQEASSELRTVSKTCHIVHPKPESDLLYRFSTLSKLLRVTAWCKRFITKSRKSADPTFNTSFLTPQELHSSLLLWVGIVQKHAFKEDLVRLNSSKTLERSSPLLNLNPFVDKDGLLRVGGRLDQSMLNYDNKHPYILPKNSQLSKLVIDDAHLRSLHSGIRNTLATIRQRFWILGGRPTIKREVLKCVTCARYRSERAQQLMGQLPPSRSAPSRPFLHSGVDYAGPFLIKSWHGRKAKQYKGYVALFICASTSAIHLELVTGYSAEAFIAAYKRFTARRGICATLTSDCGTTFIGANSELKRLFSASTKESDKLRHLLSNDGTQWKFNPPAAPHFGGHWEAGVKSVKYHLKRVIGNATLTYEDFSTVLAQTEAVLNSRPLCHLTEDPDDLSILTPAHFLVGEALTTIPEPNLLEVPTSRLTRWKLTRQILESFWKKWSREYLQQLQAIYKWRFPSSTIKIGSVVLITDEQLPPCKWPIARVIDLHPGRDGLIRVVTLKTATTTLKRPIVKLCPLPIE